ncbi:hypothetical protein HanRHA438_Chr03g0117811 [Helianthus annuus]|nr:hypothetical protein HanRHA438_Chr03g0117811 [Helianthus annuus]
MQPPPLCLSFSGNHTHTPRITTIAHPLPFFSDRYSGSRAPPLVRLNRRPPPFQWWRMAATAQTKERERRSRDGGGGDLGSDNFQSDSGNVWLRFGDDSGCVWLRFELCSSSGKFRSSRV